jgi:exodeoxyribonuclease VII small subunit
MCGAASKKVTHNLRKRYHQYERRGAANSGMLRKKLEQTAQTPESDALNHIQRRLSRPAIHPPAPPDESKGVLWIFTCHPGRPTNALIVPAAQFPATDPGSAPQKTMPRKTKDSSQDPSAAKKGIGFEEAIEQLEEITRKLESGAMSLDESIKAYESGMELRKICSEMLSRAEKKLEFLERRSDGSLEKKPIMSESAEPDDGGDESSTEQNRLFQES